MNRRIFHFVLLIIFLYQCSLKEENTQEAVECLVSNSGVELKEYNFESVVFYFAEEAPVFKQGLRDAIYYPIENIRYPKSAIIDSIEGQVRIGFIIEKNGAVSNIELLRGVREDINKECIRVFEGMPNWKPGKQKKVLVRGYFIYVLNFSLKHNDDKKGIIITPDGNYFNEYSIPYF